VSVGFSSDGADEYRRLFLPEVIAHSQEPVGAVVRRTGTSSSWARFDPGRLFDWPLLSLGGNIDDVRFKYQLRQLRENFLTPLIDRIDKTALVYEILARDEVPFDWVSSNGALRSAEMLAFGLDADISRPVLEKDWDDRRKWIAMSLKPTVSPASLLNALFHASGGAYVRG